MTVTEAPLYTAGRVHLSQTLLTVGTAQYPIAAVASWRVESTRRDPGWWWVGFGFSAVPLCLLALVPLMAMGSDDDVAWGGLLVTLAVLGFVAYGCLRQVSACKRVTHHLVLRTAGGDVQALSADTATEVAAVADALAKAVAARG